MKEILDYITAYSRTINKKHLAICSFFIAIFIFANFYYKIDERIDEQNSVFTSFFYRYIIFLVAFGIPYILYLPTTSKNYFENSQFILMALISPAIFSWKIGMSTELNLSENSYWNYYWNQIIYWPLRLIVLIILLIPFWKLIYKKESFFGFTIKRFKWKPYILMLMIMVPLIALASTQPDFLKMYPKLDDVNNVLVGIDNKWFFQLLHELSYGSDFISVELFFRGFLILGFVKFAGKDAIIPMACFYCTIHFGKPLGECISSYFGGILLGIVVLNTRSIIGGLVVHLGIAWLMELGGYIGNAFR